MTDSRTAKEIIDQAINHNRTKELDCSRVRIQWIRLSM